MPVTTVPRPPVRFIAMLVMGAALAGCSLGFGGGGGGLAPGLVAQMDKPGAVLDKREALNIINHYRATTGAAALSNDSGLDSLAQTLATQYSSSGKPPSLPPNVRAIRISAGYSNFAETFSGWRNSPADAAVLADAAAHRGGVGVAYNPSSDYGTYWVLLLAE
jgi:hypothetical protein